MYEKLWNMNKVAFGGDYNPEQWDQETWKEDMRLFKLAHIDTVTLNVFSWASLQPSEDTYNFSQLDQIMDMVRENGLKVVLATSTGAHPAWMAKKYPDILEVEFDGTKRTFGGRHNSCPHSPAYRKYAPLLAKKLAERYKDYDNIIAWHISNEYGGECFCENCQNAFRQWLKKKYGNIETLNKMWDTAFWGHTFYDWDEIVLPNRKSEHFAYERTMFQGISLDYRHFWSQSLQEVFNLEKNEIRAITPNIPVTTNLMGFYKILNYREWAKDMDFISWDNYPSNDMSPAQIAIGHEIMRGVKQGQPFILMEQTPSVTNWQPYNALKRPGVMRLWSYQAVAHGSDSIMFFQMRRSIGACEKYHGAIIDHAGHENTRVFREAAALGAELAQIKDAFLGTRVPAKAAIIFDWDNWWALEYSAGPSILLKFRDEVQNYYDSLYRKNVMVDIIGSEDSFEGYDLIIAPTMYMVRPGVDEKLRSYVKNGGHFVTTFMSGYVEDHDLVITGGYPGKLRDILGIWVEESDALPEGMTNHFTWQGVSYEASILCDLLHSEGAKVLATYDEDFYSGMPALTVNEFGQGKAYYVATRGDKAFYDALIDMLLAESGVKAVADTPEGVEATLRVNETDQFLFLLNHNKEEVTFHLGQEGKDILTNQEIKDKITLPGYGVAIIQK